MRKSRSSRPSRAANAAKILNRVERTLEEDIQPAIAELRAAIEARRRQEQRNRPPAKRTKKLAAPRSRKSSRKSHRSLRP